MVITYVFYISLETHLWRVVRFIMAEGTGEYIFMNRGKRAREDTSSSGEDRFEIGPRRFVEVTKFKGSKYVNVREYYRDGDRWMPSKKGIALRPDEFHMLMECNATVWLLATS